MEEYASLRTEILAWQERRVSTLSSTTTLIGVILGVSVTFKSSTTKPSLVSWTALSAAMPFIVFASMMVCLYAADASSRISAYLKIYHSSENQAWEAVRTAAFSSSFRERVTKSCQLALVITGRLGIQKSDQGH